MSPYLLRGLTQQQQKAAPALFWIKSAVAGFCSTYSVLNSLDLKSRLLPSSQPMISGDNYPGTACQPNSVNKGGPLAGGEHLGSTGDLLYRRCWHTHTGLMGCFHVAPHVNAAP